jgi:hypothetical protein
LRLFTDVLRDFRKGAVVAKASEDLQAVTQAVMETGKPGQQAEFKMVVADVEAKTALKAFMGAANPCRFMAVG